MFSFIKKLFGASPKTAEKKSAVPAEKSARSRKNSTSKAAAKAGGKPESTAPKRRDPRPPRERRERTAANSAAPASRPQAAAPKAPEPAPVRPEKLDEVPVVEGKTRFCDYPIHKDILFAVQRLGFQYATPIQAMTLPHLLDGRDIAGKAQTGTGKTAAFLIAAFTYLLNHPIENRRPGSCRVLVLAPTRELAMQIHKDAEDIGIFTGLHNVVVFGGMDHEKQRRELEKPVDVLIGTPGRIIDYSRGGSLHLHDAEFLIIDEADRMLDMGFIPDVRRIVAQLPKRENRHTMMFSATLEDSIMKLAAAFLNNPITLESEPDRLVNDDIEQTFYTVTRDEKLALLLYFINHFDFDRMLIFGNRKDVNSRLQRDLGRYGIRVPLLSGDIAQEKRIKILDRFREGTDRIVIATDVAARGIHVDDVSIVINYDLPERPEDYVHRIGRTGRAGHKGKSISFLCEYGAYNLPAIEKMLDTRFPSILPEEDMLKLPPRDPNYRPEPEDRSERPPRRNGGRSGFHGGSRRGR